MGQQRRPRATVIALALVREASEYDMVGQEQAGLSMLQNLSHDLWVLQRAGGLTQVRTCSAGFALPHRHVARFAPMLPGRHQLVGGEIQPL